MASIISSRQALFKAKSLFCMIPFPNSKLILPERLIQVKPIHNSPANFLFFEIDPKDEYRRFRPKPTPKELIRVGLKQIKEEIRMWKNEIKDAWEGDILLAGAPGKLLLRY